MDQHESHVGPETETRIYTSHTHANIYTHVYVDCIVYVTFTNMSRDCSIREFQRNHHSPNNDNKELSAHLYGFLVPLGHRYRVWSSLLVSKIFPMSTIIQRRSVKEREREREINGENILIFPREHPQDYPMLNCDMRGNHAYAFRLVVG